MAPSAQANRGASGASGPSRNPMSPKTRRLMWMAVGLAPLIVYPAIAWWLVASGEEPAMTPWSPATWFALVLAAGQLLFVLRRRGTVAVDDAAFILGLAMTEAIAIEGFILYMLFGTEVGFAAMLALALVGALLTRPT
ncbi:MAG: hypothetical protein M1325_05015 [Actinobacteria bacterium]|nr:hypothetical protein [Actinomycetota bacterium]